MNWRIRIRLLGTPLIALFFIGLYGQQVCPFLNTLTASQWFLTLGLIFALQTLSREFLFQFFEVYTRRPPPRQAYLLSIATWIFAGVTAMLLHAFLYQDFPFASHIKLLSGYWGLGGGILAQWDYVYFEKIYKTKQQTQRTDSNHLERITRRIMEGYLIFTMVPSLFVLLIVRRYVVDGVIPTKVFLEILYLTAYFGTLASIVSWYFGRKLRSDARQIMNGITDIRNGDFNTRIDSARHDELGEMVGCINEMLQTIRTIHANQEELIKQRTHELQASLEQVSALKVHQDGDYFLISLLTEPLNVNQVRSERVRVQSISKQKKSFQFRKWSKEIGGDLCIAHSLVFQNRPYTIFVNADAMGKSIQGAGGALVIGAVFQSIIDRTKQQESIEPKIWLENTFIELDKIFQCFHGSMLVSAVMGVVDEATGMLYHLNAEHPEMVLYRAGKARFIGGNSELRKIGTTGLPQQLEIFSVQLRSADIILAGSDGRDDLLLDTTESGVRIINDDEFLFLQCVEDSEGDLEETYRRILQVGELTDDFSLMQIVYSSPSKTQFVGIETKTVRNVEED